MATLPSRLFTASPASPYHADVETVASSGSEVAPPSSTMPAKACPIPVFRPMMAV
jgi:hypothetical protein